MSKTVCPNCKYEEPEFEYESENCDEDQAFFWLHPDFIATPGDGNHNWVYDFMLIRCPKCHVVFTNK